nr:inorganic phosphate transporter [Pseudothermotoga thermarum]
MAILYLLPAIFFGWSLGASAPAASFGPSIGSGMISYRKAVVVGSIFIVIGAVVGGAPGLKNIGTLANFSTLDAACALFAGAVVVTTMTWLKLPASVSQAILGGIIGISVKNQGFLSFNWFSLIKFFAAWILTPLAAMLVAYLIYVFLSEIFRKIKKVQYQDLTIRILTWVAGIYGVYSLGANNVANVTGVFVGNLLTIPQAALLGGLSIAFGFLTFSKRVMMTVGKGIIELDHFSSMIAILGQAFTVWIFSLVGIPISATQAIVGSVIGAGYAKGERLSNPKLVYKIVAGWTQVPAAAGLIAYTLKSVIEAIFQLTQTL